MSAPPVLLLARDAISKLATTRDYLAAMQTAFADLAASRFEVPAVGHVPGVGGMFHIKAAQRSGSPPLAVMPSSFRSRWSSMNSSRSWNWSVRMRGSVLLGTDDGRE